MSNIAQNRSYWLWVVRPEYYFDETGRERKDLEPSDSPEEGWWTCHQDTHKGDLALLYRTTPMKDIRYLIQAESDAYSIRNEELSKEKGWDYGCGYRILYKFSQPITITMMKGDNILKNWSPLKQNFRRRVFAITPTDWKNMTRMIVAQNPKYAGFISTLGV